MLQSRTKYFNREQQMYVFNRNRVFFEWILHYYQSNGDLYIPKVSKTVATLLSTIRINHSL